MYHNFLISRKIQLQKEKGSSACRHMLAHAAGLTNPLLSASCAQEDQACGKGNLDDKHLVLVIIAQELNLFNARA